MIRARIIVEGKVQSAGYRDEVEDIALDLGITGFVRNMVEKDRVEIVCEADEKVIDEFLKNVKIKNEIIDVKKLTAKKTKPTGEFKAFRVIRGDKDSEIAERMDEAVKHLKGMKKGLYGVRDEVKGSREDIKGVREEIREFRTETKESFNSLDEKYHVVSQSLKSSDETQKMMKEELSEMRKEFSQSRGQIAKLVEHIGLLVKNHIEKEEKERKTHAEKS
ncbi:hypothetical protein FP804_00460 [archaeon]|nr:hypothetical protein [archaeon]